MSDDPTPDDAMPDAPGGSDVPGASDVPGGSDVPVPDTSIPDGTGSAGEDCEDPFDGPTYCTYTSYEHAEGPVAEDVPATGEDADGLAAEVWDALYGVEDPEMPVSVVDLGLIYGVEMTESDDGSTHVRVDMTLTYTGCPARDMLTDEVREAAASPGGVDAAEVRLVWSPEWSLDLVTERGKRDLEEFGLSV